MINLDKIIITIFVSAIILALGYIGATWYDSYHTYISSEDCVVIDKMSAYRTYEDDKSKEYENVYFISVKEENPNPGYNFAATGKGYVRNNGDKTFSFKITKEEFESLKIGDKIKIKFERGVVFDTVWGSDK